MVTETTGTSRRWNPFSRRSVSTGGPKKSWEQIFLQHRARIELAAARVAQRAGLPPQEVEDFVAGVRLKLIDDDYAVLRKHRGQSSMATYLITVVHNAFKDHCDQRFGKYRPSAKAKELGPCGRALERALVVEQMELEAAVRALAQRSDLETTESELLRIAEQLPPAKAKRSFVDEQALEQIPVPSAGSSTEHRWLDRERTQNADRLSAVLRSALQTLPAQDFLILKLHLRDGQTLATIADRLQVPQRPLYRRKNKSLDVLRDHLESQGLSWPEVRDLLEWNRDLGLGFDPDDSHPGSAGLGAAT